jgi:tryptophan synthase alpha subunit
MKQKLKQAMRDVRAYTGLAIAFVGLCIASPSTARDIWALATTDGK